MQIDGRTLHKVIREKIFDYGETKRGYSPKSQFLTIDANKLLSNPDKYLEKKSGTHAQNEQLKTFQVAFYGSVKGKQKRIQTIGTEKKLYQVAPLILGNNFSNDVLSIIIGNWSKNTVQVDFDKMPFDKVKYYAFRANNWFKLNRFIILESSKTEHIAKEKGKKGKVITDVLKRIILLLLIDLLAGLKMFT